MKTDNLMVMKINRPSYQTRSSFVENVLKMRDQINNFLCVNVNPSGRQYEKIIRNFMSANLRPDEAEKIIKKIPKWYEKELTRIRDLRKEYFKEADEDQAYYISWDNAYKEANALLDKYYRIKGNEIKIGLIGRHGYNIQGKEIEFVDIEAQNQESENIESESVNAGVST